MTKLSIKLLGELTVVCDGKLQPLPRSKKTRALLAYLALTNRPHRRDRLCELFWGLSEDPRGSLRWSLSKLRPIINDQHNERLATDRERVTLLDSHLNIDLTSMGQLLDSSQVASDVLLELHADLSEPLLAGLDLPDQQEYQRWLTAERETVGKLRAEVARRLAMDADTPVTKAVTYCREWLELDPFNPDAGNALLMQLQQLGEAREAHVLGVELARRFQRAGIEWRSDVTAETPDKRIAHRSLEKELLSRQRVHFCTAADGVHIAYGVVGEGPPLVKAANWLSHLELDWDAPIWSPLFQQLAREHTFIRYDERGNGLSDWDVDEISFEVFVTDLETTVDALGLERFPLLGISQGASVSIEYAVRHPERVSHLILFGGYPAGWRIGASAEVTREREAVMTLTEAGWGQDNPVYRQIFSSTFMPGATVDELSWFNEFQRQTTSPANAVRFLSAFGDIDVRHRLAAVQVPTLVLHSRGDQRISIQTGRELAARIPNAQFVTLDSDNHLLLGREPASQQFVEAVQAFIAK